MNLWQCPHPALFLKDICDSLESRQDHCIVSMPERLIPSFLDELIPVWSVTHNSPKQVRLENNSSLIDILSPLFLLDSAPPALDDLKGLLLKGAEMLVVVLPEVPLPIEKEFFDILLKDLMAYAKNCRDNDLRLDWTMLVIAPAGRKIPDQDIGLKCFRWWGYLHNSDVEYAVEDTLRASLGTGTKKERLAYWWIYPLCKGIAMSDPELVEMICQSVPQDMNELMHALADHELNTEENGKLVRAFLDTAPRYTLSRNIPPQGLAAELWHKGILDINCQGNVALHPAALLAAACQDELEKLVIHGQMQFFLPLVQEVHTLLYHKVEELVGGDLKAWIAENKDLESAQSEIGPFYAFLSYLNKEKGKRVPPKLISAAKKWRDFRNNIAHINMLSRQVIDDAFNSYEDILAMS